MMKKNLYNSFVVLVSMFFLTGITTFSQVQMDSSQTYYWTWSVEPTFKHPPQKEAYYNYHSVDQSYHKVVKEFFGKFRNNFEGGANARNFELMSSIILHSDVVFISRKSKYIFEIQHGNYNDAGYGLQTVGVYTHYMFDVSQGKILPEVTWSITY